jgi:hypothetical protein
MTASVYVTQPALNAGRQSTAHASSRAFPERFDLVVLKLNDPLLAFVEPSAEDGEQNVPRLENDVHWTLGRGEENRPASEARCVNSSGRD